MRGEQVGEFGGALLGGLGPFQADHDQPLEHAGRESEWHAVLQHGVAVRCCACVISERHAFRDRGVEVHHPGALAAEQRLRRHRWRASRATAAVRPGCDCPTRETLRGAPPRSRSRTSGRAAAPRASPWPARRWCRSAETPAPPGRFPRVSGCPASARARSTPRGRGRTRSPGRAGCARRRRPGARTAPFQ